jgi:hypothetical protein
MAVHCEQAGHSGQNKNINLEKAEDDMKKIVCVLVMLLLSLTLVMPNVSTASIQQSAPMSSQEMSSIVGGGWCAESCVSLVVVKICVSVYDPTGWFCE